MRLTIGLTYDLRSEYLAEGFSEEETAEFDRDDTVAAIEKALQALGHRTERIGHGRKTGRRPGGRAALGSGVQYRRRPLRHRPRGPGAGAVGHVPPSLTPSPIRWS